MHTLSHRGKGSTLNKFVIILHIYIKDISLSILFNIYFIVNIYFINENFLYLHCDDSRGRIIL